MASTTVPAVCVDHIDLHTFAAASATRPGKRHFVTARSTGHFTCSCEAGFFGRTDCRHRVAVRAHLIAFGWDGVTVTAPEPAPSDAEDPFEGLVAA